METFAGERCHAPGREQEGTIEKVTEVCAAK